MLGILMKKNVIPIIYVTQHFVPHLVMYIYIFPYIISFFYYYYLENIILCK